MAYSTTDILGRFPSVVEPGFEQSMRNVAWERVKACPIERAVTYYFDPENGDDANDGTVDSPKQTVAAMNSLLASNVRIRVRAGSVIRGTTGINLAGGCLDSYGAGPPPIFSFFTQTVAESSGAWTNATGDRWTTTSITAAGWVRRQDIPLQPLANVASTAEVESTPNSWYIAGGTLHVNAGSGENPNDHAWEATPTTPLDTTGLTATGTGGRVDGIRFDGWGLTGTIDQSWGIKFTGAGDSVFVATRCESYYNPRHNLGSFISGGGTPSGGRSLFQQCRFGFCQEINCTPHVSYADDGDNECLMLDCEVAAGRLPVGAGQDSANGVAFFAHSDGGVSDRIGALVVINSRLTDVHGYPCERLGFANDNPGAANPDDLRACRAIFHRCRQDRWKGGGGTFFSPGCVYSACEIYIQPANQSTQSISANASVLSGWIVNSIIDIDLADVTEAQFGFSNQASTTDIRGSHMVGCHLHIRGNGSTTTWSANRDLHASSGFNETIRTNCAGMRIENNIVTAENFTGAAECHLGFFNDANMLSDLAYYGLSSTANQQGITEASDSFALTHLIRPSYISPMSSTNSSIGGFGFDGLELDTSALSVGPTGAIDYAAPASWPAREIERTGGTLHRIATLAQNGAL